MSRHQVRLTAAYFLRTFAFCVCDYGAVCILCTVLWCCLCTVYNIMVLCVYCIQYCGVVCVLCTVLWCCLCTVYSIMVLFVYCVRYRGAVCVLCTVSQCCLRTVYSITVLFAYCVEYYGTVSVLCTVLWYCFHTMCSNIVVLAYHVHCRSVSAGFTFPTPNNLKSDHEFHILFTFQYRITQRNPQGRYIVGSRNHTSNVTMTNSWHAGGAQTGSDREANRRLRSCCSVESWGK